MYLLKTWSFFVKSHCLKCRNRCRTMCVYRFKPRHLKCIRWMKANYHINQFEHSRSLYSPCLKGKSVPFVSSSFFPIHFVHTFNKNLLLCSGNVKHARLESSWNMCNISITVNYCCNIKEIIFYNI